MMRLKDLHDRLKNEIKIRLLEDQRDDKMYREQAKKIFDDIINVLSKKFHKIDPVGDKSLGLNGNTVGLNGVYFVFNPGGRKTSGGKSIGGDIGVSSGKYDYVINISVQGSNKPLNPASLSKLVKRSRENVLHELIHLIDFMRTNNRALTDFSDQPSITDYYNSPQELNAYYQEAVFNIEDFVDSMGPIMSDVLNINSFRDFKRWVLDEDDIISKEFYNALTTKNRRRFLSRLYQYYDEEVEPVISQ